MVPGLLLEENGAYDWPVVAENCIIELPFTTYSWPVSRI